MAKINLQLFAKLNTDTSIVDYLKSQGQDSSYTARKKLAQELGITNYSGTAKQNTQMLKTLKNQASSSNKNSTPTSTQSGGIAGAKAPNATPITVPKQEPIKVPASTPVTSVNGVDQSLIDKINSTYTQSDAVTNAQNEANIYKDTMTEISNQKDIISQETWDAINTPFSASSAYQEAWAQTQQMLSQLSSGRTSYTDQIKDMMSKIQNREDFQYDVSTDTLFQQSLASAMASGQTAMQDTIGQASALTGGYASTYATSAGNQAYNSYIQDAYNNLPEYYQMAMEAYQMEGQDMYNQLAMLNEADASEYQRMYDSWNANFTNTQQMYAQEYGAWQDSVNNAYQSAGLQLNEHGQRYDQAFNTYSALQNQANTLYAQEFQKWQNEVANALSYAGMQQNDYWNTKEFNESQRQFDESQAQSQSQFVSKYDYNGDGNVDSKDIELQRQWEKEDAYIKNYDGNGDGKVDDKDKTATLKEPTETQMQKALEAYNTGGEDGLERYVASLGSSIDVDMLIDYAIQYGNAPIGSKIKDGFEDFGNALKDLFTGGAQTNTTTPNVPTWEEIKEQRKNSIYKNRLLK